MPGNIYKFTMNNETPEDEIWYARFYKISNHLSDINNPDKQIIVYGAVRSIGKSLDNIDYADFSKGPLCSTSEIYNIETCNESEILLYEQYEINDNL